jgi:pimeloyl-ACP methyl ester carboxylesterase
MTIEQVEANGITMAYESLGDPGGRPLLLVMGLGSQLVSWPPALCRRFVDRGFRVVRFDNRDVGQSTHFSDAGVPDLAALAAGNGRPPYLVEDMAADTAGLLETLGMAPAHVLGVSLGGMIVQSLGIGHPDVVRSLTSVMSTPSVAAAPSEPDALAALMAPPATSRDEFIERAVDTFRIIGSPGFAFDEGWQRERAALSYDRDPDTAGRLRQLCAALFSPDRAPGLTGVRLPTLVIHGAADPLITPSGGRATAAAVPGAEYLEIAGMGHDLPVEVWDTVIERVVALADRADSTP